jgi:hypothetical protein
MILLIVLALNVIVHLVARFYEKRTRSSGRLV